MSEQGLYQTEINFINRKIPANSVKWEAREITEELISPFLSDDEATRLFGKLQEAMKVRAGIRLTNLLQKKFIQSKSMFRVIVSVKWLRQVFAGELGGGDGGGGGPGVNRAASERIAASMTLRRR